MSLSEKPPFEREYQALRAGRAVVELAGWSSISVRGTDRQTFLHNFCTNDVKRLAPGENCEAFFCNVKGKIVGHGVVHCKENELLILGAPGQAARLISHLDRYIIREDVQLEDCTESRTYTLVVSDAPGPTGRIAWDLTGSPYSWISEVPESERKSFGKTMGEQRFALVGPEAFTARRIEAGFPLFGVDFDEENLPQEVGRDRQAISFTKGCYLGQETVARIDALGHVNQQLVGVKFAGGTSVGGGMELAFSGAKAGVVTSAAYSPTLGTPLGLAMVRRGANAIGTRLESAVGECEVAAFPAHTNGA